MNARRKLWTDLVLLGSVFLTCASGLVLLFDFHVARGCFRSEALGLSRLAWQNIHRFGAVLALAAAATHATANARPVGVRALRVLRGQVARQDVHELAFYLTMTTVFLTGFYSWLFVGGSAPLSGPIHFGPIPPARHGWIDLHHLTALLFLFLTTNHVRRRWDGLRVLARCALSRPSVSGAATPSSSPVGARRERTRMRIHLPFPRHHQTPFIAIDLRLCKGCEDCTKVCPQEVLGFVAIGRHRHVRVDRACDCRGCRKCVRACVHGAIWSIPGRADRPPLGAAANGSKP